MVAASFFLSLLSAVEMRLEKDTADSPTATL